MVKLEDYGLLQSAPLRARSEHYDLVINGVEVGGGSTRIHDPDLQRYIFRELLRIDNPDGVFGHLLEAFTMGCPPHAGMAIGLDRLTAMLSYTPFIRDVIAFPKTITGADPLFHAPSKVSNDKLESYHLKWNFE
jgi:aspartyl-tRNA synthetase